MTGVNGNFEKLKEALSHHDLWSTVVETGFNYMMYDLETYGDAVAQLWSQVEIYQCTDQEHRYVTLVAEAIATVGAHVNRKMK